MTTSPAPKTYSLTVLEEILQSKQRLSVSQFSQPQQLNDNKSAIYSSPAEKGEIFAKLITAASSLNVLPEKEELYLEQQVSDLLGFEVSSVYERKKLTHIFGKIQALDEFSLSPHPQSTTTINVCGAKIKPRRPSMDWPDVQTVTNNHHHFFLANHLLMLEDWHHKYVHYKNWYKWRKLLVINPFDRIAIVAKLAAYTLPDPMRYQFGGSPDLIRNLQAWSPQAQGLVCVFFIPDSENIELGIHNL